MVENNKPTKIYKAGVISLNLWENETQDGNTMISFTLNRSYKDKDDKWQKTQNLRVSDLPKLKILLDEAYKDSIFNEIEN